MPRSNLNTVQLDRVKVAVKDMLAAKGVGSTVSLSADVEWHAEQLALEISAHVLAEKLPPHRVESAKTVEFECPDGWWQMWLHEHRSWPVVRRWVARRPVRMRTERRLVTVVTNLERFRTYPKASVPLPENQFGGPVLVAYHEQSVTVENL